ncbi:Ig-like domain-containing protein [Yersinia sp. HM-2024]|uniref:Ig-like domain-containing protein n=1 Tax=Yersinia sp. HM-2024 TaxID=3344550 RepID=UPI00370D800C
MNTTKIFANEDSIIDLSSLGSKNEVKIVISGPDMNVVTPKGTTVIINGALYSSIKGNKLSVKFNDGTVPGNQLVSNIDLKNIKLDRIDSTIVDSNDNNYKNDHDIKSKNEAEKEQAKLKQKIEEAKKTEEAADKAKNEANKAISEMVEAQNASKEIENVLNNFLGDIASKENMAQSPDNQEVEEQKYIKSVQENDQVLIKPINVNTGKGRSNSSSKPVHISDEPILPENISVSLKLDNSSNSGSKSDTLTNIGIPAFIGTTGPNTAIIIKLDDISISSLVSDSLGNFVFTSPIELDEGNYVFSVDATDESGATGTTQLTITVDKTTMLPTFELSVDDKAAAGNNLTAKLTPTIKGMAEKDAVVEIYIGSKLLTTVSVNNSGEWEYRFKNSELAEGNNTIRLVAIDKADNRATNTGIIDVDSIPPEKPTITLESDSNSGLKNDNVTQVKQPTFLGKSEPGAKVELFLGSEHLKDVVADKNGNWSFTHLSQLTDGKYTLRAIASDLAGNKSEANSLHFEIDTVISKFSAGIIDEDDSGITKDNITNVLSPRLAGLTEPDCAIEVTNESTGKIVNISSNKNGAWSFTFLNNSVEGNNKISFKVTDKADNSEEYFFNYHVDTVAPIVPTAALNNFVTLPNDHVVTKEELPVFVGTAEPGSTVKVMLAGRAEASVNVGSNGQWEYSFPDKLLDGNYQIDFLAQDVAGNKSTKLNYSFIVQTDTAVPTAVLDPTDDSGIKGDWITSNQSGLTLAGTAQQYATVKVYIGEKLIGTQVADEAGVWGLDIRQNLPDDKYNIKVVATDKLSLTSTQDYQLIIDSFISQPSIKLHDSSDTGIKSDNITKVTTPSFTCQAEANSTLTLYVNGKLEGEVIVGADGVWNISTKSILNDSIHHAVVESKDAADNSSKSIEYKFEVISSTIKPTLKLLNDTGLDTNDSITNENKPNLIGTSAAYARVNILLGTKPVGNVLANEKGEWEYKFSDAQKLDDGKYTLSAWVEDVAGNTEFSTNLLIEVDTNLSIPAIELSSVTDSGAQDDKLTHFSKPVLLIKNVDADVREVQVWDKSSNMKIGLATNLTKGVWSYTFIDVLPDGEYQFYVKAEDIAGNSADSQPFTLNIDTELTEPTITLAAGEDTGHSVSDGLTNKKRPIFDLSNIDSDVNKVTVEVIHDGKTLTPLVATKSNDQWGFTLPTDWADGKYQLTVSVTDEAGNDKKSAPLEVTVDTELAEPTIVLAVGQDTGSDQHDNLTHIATPKFVINTDKDVEILQVRIDGGQWVEVTAGSAGVWSYTPSASLSDAEHKLEAKAIDKAGNETLSSLTFTTDTELNVPVIALAAGEDTGHSGSDGLTNQKRPTFALSDIDSDVNDVTVEVTHDGKKLTPLVATKSNDQWGFTLPTDWVDGNYQLTVSVTDEAGNHKKSAPLVVQVDTKLREPTIALAAGEDTGSSASDGLTNKNRPKFALSNIDPDVNEVMVEVTHDGNTLTPLVATKSNDQWGFTLPTDWIDGNYQLTVSVTDEAGNHKKSEPLTVQVDTELTKPTIALAADEDTGHSVSDGLTNKKRPTFALSNIDPDVNVVTVEVTQNGKKPEVVTATKTGNQWGFTPSTDWVDGEYQLTVSVTDKAGNKETSPAVTVQVDSTAPVLAIALAAGQDTGSDQHDNLTHIATPKFLINTDKDVQILQVRIDGGQWVEVTEGSAGAWSYTPTASLSDAEHKLEAKAIDKAGNETFSSLMFTTDTELNVPTIILKVTATDTTGNIDSTDIVFTIDTTTIDPTIALAEHSPNDNLEALNLFPEFKGVAEALSSISLLIDGVIVDSTTADANGAWSWKPKTAMKMGDHTVSVIATDIAENTSAEKAIIVKIPYFDIINPTIKLDEISDSGVLGDFITSELQPTITGLTLPNAKVVIYLNNHNIDSVSSDSSGYYSYTLPKQSEGAYSLKVGIEDPRDAQEILSEEMNLVIDAQVEDISWSVANEKNGYISTATPVVTGTSEPNSKITILVNGVKHEEVTASETGDWSRLLPHLGADGKYTVAIQVKDIAGNEKTFDSKILTVDTENNILSVALKATDDTGAKGNDNLTNKSDVTLEGQAEPGAKLMIHDENGDFINEFIVDSSGNWSSDVKLSNGSNKFTVRSWDKAGNSASKDIAIELDNSIDISDITLHKDSNTGDKFDLVTQERSPILQASTDPHALVEVMINGKSQGTVTADGTGRVQFTLPDNSRDGEYQVKFIATDLAGNEKSSSTATVTIDSEISHFEVDNIPEITNQSALPISGQGEPGATVDILVDGILANSVTVEQDGTWSTSASLKKEGHHRVKVKISDAAGNVKESDDFAVELDSETIRPTLQLAVATNSAATDDVLTNFKKPILTGTAEAGSTISLSRDDTVFAEVKVDHTGNWSYQYEDELIDGEYYLRATAKDLAGNTESSKSLTMIIDSKTNISKPYILTGKYNGIDSDITVANTDKPGFYLYGESGQNVKVFVDGKYIDTTKTTFDHRTYKLPVDLEDGHHTIYFTIEDKAGNTETSGEYKFVVDTSNTTPVTMDTIDGVTLESFIAKNGKYYIREKSQNMMFSGKAEADTQIQIKVNGLMLPQNWVDNSGVVRDKTWTDENGMWLRSINTANFSEGELTIEITSTDRGGHINSNTYFLNIDTGISEFTSLLEDNRASDGISWGSDKDVTVMHGKGEVGAKVSLMLDGQLIEDVDVGTDGNWKISTDKLPTGESKIILTIKDPAGHSKSESKTIFIERGILAAVEITKSNIVLNDEIALSGTAIGASWVYIEDMNGKRVDTVIVNATTGEWSAYIPYQVEGKVNIYSKSKIGRFSESKQLDLLKEQGVITLDTDSDKGALGDNITSNAKPKFVISDIDNDVISVVLNINGNQFNASKIGKGQWTYTPDGELSHGDYKITATLTDNANTTTSKSYDFSIDTELTQPTIELDVVEGQNIVTDGNDTLIRPSQPGFIIRNIDEDVSEVTVLILHNNIPLSPESLKQDINGDWRFTAPEEWQDGSYQLSVQVTDKAGNTKTSDSLSMVIVPVASVTQVELINKTGNDETDNLTNDKLPQFSIKVSEGVNKVLVSTDNGINWINATSTGSASIWGYIPSSELPHGQYQLMVKVVDKMNGQDEKSLAFSIDTELTQPSIELAVGEDNGSNATDNITNKSQPRFDLHSIDSDIASVKINVMTGTSSQGYDIEATYDHGTNKWSFTPSTPWEDDTYKLTVNVEDRAGNKKSSAPFTVNIDTQPVQPEILINPEDTTQSSADGLVVENSTESQFAELSIKPLSHDNQEDEYRITLLESSEDGTVTQLQKPEFEISVPKDVTSVVAVLDGREYELPVVDQKALFQAYMPSVDGKYTLEVKFTAEDAGFIIKEKEFTIDHSSDEIVNSMAGNGKDAKEIEASGLATGQQGNIISEIFTNSSVNYIAPIDEINDYY